MSPRDSDLFPPDAPGKASVAYDHLKQSAINGRLRPGRRLAPQDLTSFYRVSATPIRDAMVQLAIEGFIAREAGRGFAVKPFSVEDQRERLELCFFSLSSCLQVLGEPPPHLLAALGALDDQDVDEGDDAADRLTLQVEAVFDEMASACHNTVLSTITRLVIDQTHFVRQIDLADPAARRQTTRRLKLFADAMAAGDRDAARAIFWDKLQARLARMPMLVREANSQAADARFP